MVWNDTEPGWWTGCRAAAGPAYFFRKPVWQTGPGVPNDGFRHVPDLSIASSPDHDGYFVYTGGSLQIYGGTSIAAPTMAGIVTLLNQYLVSSGAQKQPGLGNINPTLYRMAQNSQKARCFTISRWATTASRASSGSPDCTTGAIGYNAAPAYDQASGLGSPDAYNLIHQWTSNVNAPTASAVVPSIDQNPVFEHVADADGFRWTFTITLTEEAGVATTLTGFTINGQSYDRCYRLWNDAHSRGRFGFFHRAGICHAWPCRPTWSSRSRAWMRAGSNGRQTLAVPFDGPQHAAR